MNTLAPFAAFFASRIPATITPTQDGGTARFLVDGAARWSIEYVTIAGSLATITFCDHERGVRYTVTDLEQVQDPDVARCVRNLRSDLARL